MQFLHVPMNHINLPNQMKNVKIQIKDLFVHANMDTSEKMIIVLVSKSELNIGNYQNSRLLGYYRTVSISCSEYWTHYVAPGNGWGRQGRDRMVVGFQISAYHHYRWNSNPAEGEMYAMQHYVITFVSELRQIGVFSPRTPVGSINTVILCQWQTNVGIRFQLRTRCTRCNIMW